jgi:hypothetical protein
MLGIAALESLCQPLAVAAAGGAFKYEKKSIIIEKRPAAGWLVAGNIFRFKTGVKPLKARCAFH